MRSITDGTVTNASWHSAYGNLTQITNDDGTVFYYAHQATRTIRNGQRVTAGQQIGTVGNTGNSYGAHLHLEVRVAGRTVDPQPGSPHEESPMKNIKTAVIIMTLIIAAGILLGGNKQPTPTPSPRQPHK
ncbi:M23 family metallopeptidase [Tessaracoccus sp. HDW20]|uniref:M23 family metallopeptidase n=1 Tax=Tessaracoccus coleopterorum TaxID=2714950 RepID=UPI0018D3DD6A|nr:M23 family metallopeptidase [Tessaracoccus coleopterorum]